VRVLYHQISRFRSFSVPGWMVVMCWRIGVAARGVEVQAERKRANFFENRFSLYILNG
jgi:hypothetical protein